MLCESCRIKSAPFRKQLAGFFLSEVCGYDKELGIQGGFSRLPNWQRTKSDQTKSI